MPTIVKATLTVTSEFNTASAFSLAAQTWGYITLWDIRPWLPWNSRPLVGGDSWQSYLGRTGVFDSTQAPLYNVGTQGPKGWTKRTDSVVIYDASATHAGDYPYKPNSVHGSGPFTYTPNSVTSATAFDGTSIANLVDTLVIAAYGYNSYPPSSGGPTATDELKFYGCYLDVLFDDASTTRFYPQLTAVVAPGTGVGSPTGVVAPANAIDTDATGTAATIQETNGHDGPAGALWHPAVLLIEGWSWGTVECNDPPHGVVGEAYSHSMTVTGGTAPYTWTITSGALPTGLSLNGSTGAITGTPTVVGTFDYTVSVADASTTASFTNCSITVDPWGELDCNDPPMGLIGMPYTHTFTLTLHGGTGPFAWSITAGALPTGLTLDPDTGVVSGTPTEDGNFTYTVTVTDNGLFPISIECSIGIANPHWLLDLWVWRQLTQFADTTQNLVFPPAYERALRLQLAAEFSRQYPGRDRSRIKAQLQAALAALEPMNVANSQAVEELPPPPPPEKPNANN